MYINPLGKPVNAWRWEGTRASYDARPKWVKKFVRWEPTTLVLSGGEQVWARG